MARPPVRVQIKRLGAAKALFGRYRELGGDPTVMLESFGALLEASTRNRFDTGRGPGGIPWPQTQRQRKGAGGARGPNKNKILVDEGLLLGSIRFVTRPGELELGVDGASESARNAKSHQFGVDKVVEVKSHGRVINEAFGVPLPSPVSVIVKQHSRNMSIPKRPFLGVDEDDRRDLKEVAVEILRELKNG